MYENNEIAVVTLSKIDVNVFSLNFYSPTTGKCKNSKIKLSDVHKYVRIGQICNDLYCKDHLTWEIPGQSMQYDSTQPDLMLLGEIRKFDENTLKYDAPIGNISNK